MLRGVFVAGASDGHVLGHDGVAFLPELPGDDRLQGLGFDTQQLERRAQSRGVGGQFVAPGQVLHWHGAQLDAGGGRAGLDLLLFEDGAGA